MVDLREAEVTGPPTEVDRGYGKEDEGTSKNKLYPEVNLSRRESVLLKM